METTTIRIDRETKVRLEELAADSPLARYLRNLSIKLIDKSRPVSPIEKRLDIIDRKLDKLNALEKRVFNGLFQAIVNGEVYREDKSGRRVRIKRKATPRVNLTDIEARIQSGELKRESPEHLKLLYDRLQNASRGETLLDAMSPYTVSTYPGGKNKKEGNERTRS